MTVKLYILILLLLLLQSINVGTKTEDNPVNLFLMLIDIDEEQNQMRLREYAPFTSWDDTLQRINDEGCTNIRIYENEQLIAFNENILIGSNEVVTVLTFEQRELITVDYRIYITPEEFNGLAEIIKAQAEEALPAEWLETSSLQLTRNSEAVWTDPKGNRLLLYGVSSNGFTAIGISYHINREDLISHFGDLEQS